MHQTAQLTVPGVESKTEEYEIFSYLKANKLTCKVIQIHTHTHFQKQKICKSGMRPFIFSKNILHQSPMPQLVTW